MLHYPRGTVASEVHGLSGGKGTIIEIPTQASDGVWMFPGIDCLVLELVLG